MLDANTGVAFLFAVGENFALKISVQLAAEERKNVFRGKIDHGMIDPPWRKFL